MTLSLIQTFQPPACSLSSFWVSLAFLPSLYSVTDHFAMMQTSLICPLTFCILPWQVTDYGQVKLSIFSALILQLLYNHRQNYVPATSPHPWNLGVYGFHFTIWSSKEQSLKVKINRENKAKCVLFMKSVTVVLCPGVLYLDFFLSIS